MQELFAQILDSVQNSLLLVGALLPRLLVAVLLMLVGWWLSRSVERLVVKLLRLVRLEAAADSPSVPT